MVLVAHILVPRALAPCACMSLLTNCVYRALLLESLADEYETEISPLLWFQHREQWQDEKQEEREKTTVMQLDAALRKHSHLVRAASASDYSFILRHFRM